ncbi:MAG: hypothetical protein JNK49_05080 [Planctomycetes bacterium]|nr:hypothetical protein [Planctomycetota bacterium]
MHPSLLLLPALAGTLLAQGSRSSELPVPQQLPAPLTAAEPSPDAPRQVSAAQAPAHVRSLARRGEPGASPVPPTTLPLPTAVAFDQPEANGPLWAIGGTWKARFDGLGFDFVPFFGSEAPQNFPLRVELQAARIGGIALPLHRGQVERHGAAIHTARGPLVEVVDTAMDQIEQSWVFAELPQRAAVVVDVRLAGAFAASRTERGLRFTNDHGSVDYHGAVARDAAGKSLPLEIEWLGDAARIEIPAHFVATAQLPLVLDPVLSTNSSVAPGLPANRAQRAPDVASVGPNRIACVVWSRTWSATDEDLVVQLLNADLTQAFASQYIDFTSESWALPRVAPNHHSQSFLCVAQVTVGGATWIGGRLINTANVMGPQLAIEKAGVAGHLPGNKFRPDVGGDPYSFQNNTAAFYTVVFEHEAAAGNRDVYVKQVNQDGSLRQVTPIALHTAAFNQSAPAIGVCNGPGTLSNRMLVTWQSQNAVAPFDDDIWGAYVEWNGNVLIPAFRITSSPRNERNPAVSSIANVGGADHLLLAFEEDFGTDNDVMLRVMNWSGTVLASSSLSNTSAGGAFLLRNQVAPSVDSDGTRFVVGFSEYSGTDYDTYAVTLAYLPATATLRIDDDRVPLGATPGVDEFGSSVFADFSGSSNPNFRNEYLIAGANYGSNDIEVRRYGGFRNGSFVVFPTQCGALTITTTGVPAVGSTVSFALNVPWWQYAGFVFGLPAYSPLSVCNCVLGASAIANVPGATHNWTIPRDPNLVGSFTLSIQGYALGGSACLGQIDLSNTLDFQIR